MGGKGTVRARQRRIRRDFPSDLSRSWLSEMGQAFSAALREPYNGPGGSVRISGSCGIVVPEGGGHTAEQLYEKADFALYQVKRPP